MPYPVVRVSEGRGGVRGTPVRTGEASNQEQPQSLGSPDRAALLARVESDHPAQPHRRALGCAPLAGGAIASLVALLLVAMMGAAAGAPTISIVTPANGSALTGPTITVSGTSTNAVRVQVCLDTSNCQDAAGVASWSATFDVSSLPAGSHAITACAFSSTGGQACATVDLTVTVSSTQTYRTVDSALEGYVTPALAVGGLATAILVGLVPRWYRLGQGVAQLLVGVVIIVLVLRVLTTANAFLYGLAAASLVAALGLNRFWRPKPHRGVK